MVIQYAILSVGVAFGFLSLTLQRWCMPFRVLCILFILASAGVCSVGISASDTFAKVQSHYIGQASSEFAAGAQKTRDVAAAQIPPILLGTAALAVFWLLHPRMTSQQNSEQTAAPNGGPAGSVDNSNAPGGPPSVS
jgi:hypothetical protein